MTPEEITNESIDYILDALGGIDPDQSCRLWEKQFVESVSNKWSQIRKLSDLEKVVLCDIWLRCIKQPGVDIRDLA